jgi:taurine dioxygenase
MGYSVTPLTPHTAAEVVGLDLRNRLSDAQRTDINEALARFGVLVFRDQNLAPAAFVEAGRIFGEIREQHDKRFLVPDHPLVYSIGNYKISPGKYWVPGTGYHTDHTNDPRPPKATILHAVSLPDSGGDTQYVNVLEAFDDLPVEMQERLSKLSVLHVYQSRHSDRKIIPLDEVSEATLPPDSIHPLIRINPDNGRRGIYLSPVRMERIFGMDDSEAMALVDRLMAHVSQSKYEYRHVWRPGDMVIWDNRSVLHKANADYDLNQTRYLYRILIEGEVPFGPKDDVSLPQSVLA